MIDSGFSSDEPALPGQVPERSFRANDAENGCGPVNRTIAAAILTIALGCHAAADARPTASFNVKADFQARGDGITDDSASITRAISEIVKSGGGTLFFPRAPTATLRRANF